MRILKWIGVALAASIIVLAALYAFRTDPVAMIAGKRLSGGEAPYPADWSVCNQYATVAVETRPEAPHSVTTLCVVLDDGTLIIPATEGSTKQWTANVAQDPRIRVKIGEVVYPARVERALDLTMADIAPAVQAKYPQVGADAEESPLEDFWIFRVMPR